MTTDTEKPTEVGTKTEKSAENEEQKQYTALIYFHGVGEQKRYEEVSRLVDGLEFYRPAIRQVKDLRKHYLAFEPTHRGLKDSIGRSQVGYLPLSYDNQEYRCYEAYYADLLAGGIRPGEVFFWLLKLSLMPVRIWRTRWGALPRLRRATLLGEWDRNRKKAASKQVKQDWDDRVKQLLNGYNHFVHTGQQPASSIGNFDQYVETLPPYLSKHPIRASAEKPDPDQLKKNAKDWRFRFGLNEISIILLVLSALLTLFLAAVGTFALLWQLGLAGIGTIAPLWHIPAPILPIWLTISLLIGIGFVIKGIRWFLRNYVGDLYFWTTYEETSEKYKKREEIVKRSCAYVSHVLADDNCTRVMLVGHSMGTTVAHDTILRLARDPFIREAEKKPVSLDLSKIQHFVTLASVVDKIYYLFETVTSKSANYNRILEFLRTDIGSPPFSRNKTDQTPHIHWINFWDRADVASSPLYTPTNPTFNPYHVVDNYEVAGVCLPDPASSHLEYFENRFVLEKICEVFFDNGYSFVRELKSVSLPEDKPGREAVIMDTLEKQFLGQDEKEHRFTNWVQRLAILLPWLILLYWIFIGFRPGVLDIPFVVAAVSYVLFVVVLAFRDRFLRSQRRMEVKPKPGEPETPKEQLA